MRHLFLLLCLLVPSLALAHPGHVHSGSSAHVPVEYIIVAVVAGLAALWSWRGGNLLGKSDR